MPTQATSPQGAIFRLGAIVLKHARALLVIPGLTALITLIVVVLMSNRYTAFATFFAEANQSSVNIPGALSGLAAQFGVPLSSSNTSPYFYSDLIRSRTIMDPVLTARFSNPMNASPDSISLLDLLEVEGNSLSERMEAGRRHLAELVSLSVNRETGVISLSVETAFPTLSADIANLFLELLNKFNLETRQSTARERRRFIEERLETSEQVLHQAESALQRFLEQNRRYQGAPDLEFQHDRLERRMTIQQELVTTLRRQYEEARIEEVNDTPVITTIDAAIPPQEPSAPRRKLAILGSGALALLITLLAVLTSEFLRVGQDREPQSYRELRGNWEQLRSTLRGFIGRRRTTKG